ncbi:hypothetical protein AAFF_G00213710 [Aldrovandia affinis]|uniref:Uncharacterized protein n=1 Tax=Aldrovandia affinis TaxID=143900 RepID=A0AAD7W584_9TELE|nr:hypothetical protein AAFF_G00213710 [Aldrovandia affinis]
MEAKGEDVETTLKIPSPGCPRSSVCLLFVWAVNLGKDPVSTRSPQPRTSIVGSADSALAGAMVSSFGPEAYPVGQGWRGGGGTSQLRQPAHPDSPPQGCLSSRPLPVERESEWGDVVVSHSLIG